MPLGGDRGRIKIVYVARFHPAVLTEGVVDAIFVVAIAGEVGAHVGAEFEGVVSVLDGGVEIYIMTILWELLFTYIMYKYNDNDKADTNSSPSNNNSITEAHQIIFYTDYYFVE